MKKQCCIDVHTYSLSQLLIQDRSDFTHLREFNQYKKQQIYNLRNHHLSLALNTSISNRDIHVTRYGKPYLPNEKNLSFNHSHSQQNYALAMSEDYRNIGVDLEDFARKVRFDALANHAFHPNELQQWYELNQDLEYWFRVWTTKEAVLKAVGLGIRINLNELNTQVHPTRNLGQCYHPLIGSIAFQNFNLGHALLTVAWGMESTHLEKNIPKIHIIQHSLSF